MPDIADSLLAFRTIRAALMLGAAFLAYEDVRREEASLGLHRPLVTRIELEDHGLRVWIGDVPYHLHLSEADQVGAAAGKVAEPAGGSRPVEQLPGL